VCAEHHAVAVPGDAAKPSKLRVSPVNHGR
jgi:hypothetical protein